MKKIETIWGFLLNEAMERRLFQHTQQDLSRRFHFSLSTVHHALHTPEQIGAIRKEGKFFVLEQYKKLLYYWASVRALQKDVLYETFFDHPIQEIEGLAVPKTIFAAYSAAGHHLGEAPADYAKAYWYCADSELKTARERFPQMRRSKLPSNVFILRQPETFLTAGAYTTLAHTFVDIWNLRDWYAHDFCKALEEKIDDLLS